MREDYAVVLDYLPSGYADAYKKEPVAQVLGVTEFSLLEIVPREECKLELREKIYIGPDKRDKVRYIKGRIEYPRLTATARSELVEVINELVGQDESRFVNFFNKTGAITIKQHSLELLPNIGKKHMMNILDERQKKLFESFKDIAVRVHLMPDPKRTIVERIMEEFEGKSKYHLFTRPAFKKV